MEKAAPKMAAEKAVQEEFDAKLPEELKGPTTEHFMVFVVDIEHINGASQYFNANFFVRLRWNDTRLAKPRVAIRQIPMNEVWHPSVLLANQQGVAFRSLPEVMQVHPDGMVVYLQRYTGKLSQPLLLGEFPRDTHNFTIQFVATVHQANELRFEPDFLKNNKDIRGGFMANTLSLPDWEILSYETGSEPYRPIEGIDSAAFSFQFRAKRHVGYYLWQVVLPLTVVVMMSWAAFWVGREHIGVRIVMATSSILTLIAHRFVLASLLPRLPYMTRINYFTVGSTFLVRLALIAVITTGYLASDHREPQAQRIDLWARGAFPAAFFLLFTWFTYG